MKAGRPSRTAHFVALGRAIADAGLTHVRGFRDPTARAFLTDRSKQSLAKVEYAARAGIRSRRAEAARRLGDMIALRTAVIDAAVREAIAGGARQLVILGAGYDGRAWRLDDLKGVKVFEVDHPATQADKRARVRELKPAIGDVTFVPIDFERERLSETLQRAGHDRSAPTCWIWEGVVMYLTREAMLATLGDIAKSSARGSTLIVNYHSEQRRLLMRLIFWLMGEPHISAMQPHEIAADLKAAGFDVREDSGMLDWNQRFANGEAKVDRGAFMRVAVAHR